jgi:alkanesulfonate monooxygenase SsuD/methylene tetrahydromethanopterin reductase-like flavin-dependent oxidoreductase (luciferase family)
LLSEPPDGWIIGTVDQAAEQLHGLAAVGVSRVMCQHMPHAELPGFIELLGRELAPLVA